MRILPRAKIANRTVRVSGRTWNLLCDWVEAIAGMRTSGGVVFRASRTGCAMSLELMPGLIVAKTTAEGIDAAPSETEAAKGEVILWQFTGDTSLAARTNVEEAYNLATDGPVSPNARVLCAREQPSGKLIVIWEICSDAP